MYINWMVVKSRKQTFLHIKGIYTKVLPQTMHLKIKLDILENVAIADVTPVYEDDKKTQLLLMLPLSMKSVKYNCKLKRTC